MAVAPDNCATIAIDVTFPAPAARPVTRAFPVLRGHPWLLALPLLLLAMFFATSQLDNRAFQEDELATLRLAGSDRREPLPFADFQALLVERSAEQAFGWPLLVSLWVQIAGWSEPAVRALPLLAGMLALAWTWRLGRDLFHHSVGLLAVLALATSAFFIAYMWFARAFTTVALCSTLLLWCYWRLRLQRRPARPVHHAGLLLAASALAYLHYFAVILVAAVALFHLAFGRKYRGFWRPLALFALAALLAAPQLPALFAGLEQSLADDNLKLSVLNAPDPLTASLGVAFGNVFTFPGVAGWTLLALLIAFPLRLSSQQQGAGQQPVGFPGLVLALFLALALIVNQLVQVITPGRIRYLMPIWPMMALLLARTVREQRNRRFRVAEWLLVSLVVTGIHAIHDPGLKYSFGNSAYRDRMHIVQRELLASASEGDALLAGEFANDFVRTLVRDFYLESLPLPVLYLDDEGPEGWLAAARGHSRFWLLQTSNDSERYVELATSLAENAHLCQSRDLRAIATVDLYAWSAGDCQPDRTPGGE